ncbi:Tryptophanyl-tRNA synthetase [hydrothermal vent metagenome]|uniref:tryptophan--tRNA ligase n=1 Tax=hydrothermal vent metagenome TaxID=652676 RepID=A0A3B0V2X9_9ZZZZ
MSAARKNSRIVSGMRPTGRLHMGHYHGVLENWLRLQEDNDCYFFVADWHALTTGYADTGGIRDNITEMVIDWLSVGIDPARSVIFRQSGIKEHAELFVLLSMITPVSWLERNPTYKEQMIELKDKEIHTHGFLGYPVLQTADIIIYGAGAVPVGIDQAPHIELAREIVRRFNFLYGDTFLEPETLMTSSPKMLGTDGRKMSKSYDNSVYLSDPPEVIDKKIRTMVTDTARQRKTDAGNPDICPVFITMHTLYSDEETKDWVREGCTTATIGCIECKKKVIPKVLERLEPFGRRRRELEKDRGAITGMLEENTDKARLVAGATMERVRRAMGLAG